MTTNGTIARIMAGVLALAAITLGARWLAIRRVDNQIYKAHVLDRNWKVLAGFERGKRMGRKVAVEMYPNTVTYRGELWRKVCWGTIVRTFRSTTAAD